jgi:hypothetical protein
VQIAPLIVHLATASLRRGLNAFLLKALCTTRGISFPKVAISELAQTIGFLGKFVKLNIRFHKFVQTQRAQKPYISYRYLYLSRSK